MGALIVMALMFLFFLVAIPILIISTIFLVKNIAKKKSEKQVKKISFVFSIIGTAIGLCLMSLPIGYVFLIRNTNSSRESHNVKINHVIYWHNNGNKSGDFIYNNRKYVNLKGRNSKNILLDQAVANIVPENYDVTKIMEFIFGVESTQTIYTIKNCSDYSILAIDGYNLYCAEDLVKQKEDFYANMDNYKFFMTIGKSEDEDNCFSITDIENIKQIYNYTGYELDIIGNEYQYINLFGVSNDNIMLRFVSKMFFDGDELYREKSRTYSNGEEKIHVLKLTNDQKKFIRSLLDDINLSVLQ